MGMLKLAQAVAIVEGALAEGRRRNLAPIGVAVLDAGGHLVAFRREDGAGFARFDIAFGKAWGALGMGFGTRELAERATKFPTFVAALSAVSHGRMVPSPGGVQIVRVQLIGHEMPDAGGGFGKPEGQQRQIGGRSGRADGLHQGKQGAGIGAGHGVPRRAHPGRRHVVGVVGQRSCDQCTQQTPYARDHSWVRR